MKFTKRDTVGLLGADHVGWNGNEGQEDDVERRVRVVHDNQRHHGHQSSGLQGGSHAREDAMKIYVLIPHLSLQQRRAYYGTCGSFNVCAAL